MSRTIYVNGNTLVTADGSELGLAESSVGITITPKHLEVKISTFGEVAADVQAMLAEAEIDMTLSQFDPAVVETCLNKSMGVSSLGIMPVAGVLLGAGNKLISLRIASPTGGRPWTFPSCYMTGNPISWPLGNERSLLKLTFKAIPYTSDPSTAAGAILFTRS